jgi:type I restriction enzyme R subunit
VKNKQDPEQYRQLLVPHYEDDENGQSFDTRQSFREDFYQALTEFGMCLQIALSSRTFFEDKSFSEDDIKTYKKDLRWFTALRKIARQDAQESVDYSAYEDQIRKLVDKHVVGSNIKEPDGVYLVEQLGKAQDPSEWSEDKTRNETDIIRSRVKKTIEQELADDPYAQVVFSALLKQAIAEAEALFDHPYKQYALFKDLEEKVKSRDVDSMPTAFDGNKHAKAYYGAFRLVLGDGHFSEIGAAEEKQFIDDALFIDETVRSAVAEHSISPQNIEAAIRQTLLPHLFDRMGLDPAKQVIDRVIQITRVGLSRGELRS